MQTFTTLDVDNICLIHLEVMVYVLSDSIFKFSFVDLIEAWNTTDWRSTFCLLSTISLYENECISVYLRSLYSYMT